MARALAQIGDAWSLLILREAFYGRSRFSEFVERTGAQRTVVSARLKKLVDNGLLLSSPYSDHRPRHRYTVTEKGLALAPVVVTLMAWGDAWTAGPEGPPITLTHEPCGHVLGAELVCGACDERLETHTVTPGLGSGYPDHVPSPLEAPHAR